MAMSMLTLYRYMHRNKVGQTDVNGGFYEMPQDLVDDMTSSESVIYFCLLLFLIYTLSCNICSSF